MQNSYFKQLLFVCLFYLTTSIASAQMDIMNALPSNLATHTAVQNGDWFSASTWDAGNVPSTGAIVFIPNGITVNYEGTSGDHIFAIRVDGNFNMTQSVLNNPTSVEWRFQQEGLFSHFISGAQRLKNGNTLICEGNKGLLHEVTVDKETVWKYNLPLQQKPIFRANRYLKDYPAFYGRPLERLEINIE